jgi:hypothetical protein
MDGINGITGLYALSFLIALTLYSEGITTAGIWDLYTSPLPYLTAAVIVFGIFNFRKKAVCFAGDVGSVSIAYLMLGLTAFLIFRPSGFYFSDVESLKNGIYAAGFELKYLLLLSVYGIDSFLTIVHRIFLKENILKGHRKHLYQYMVNEYKLPHLYVAFGYAILQMIINIWVMNNNITVLEAATLLLVMTFAYTLIKSFIISQISTVTKPVAASAELKSISKKYKPVFISRSEQLEDVESTIVTSRRTAYKMEGQRKTVRTSVR